MREDEAPPSPRSMDPALRLLYCLEKLVERVHHEENVLIRIDLEVLREDGIEIERAAIALRPQRVRAIAGRGNEAAAVHFDAPLVTNQPELHGEPEEPGHAAHVLF